MTQQRRINWLAMAGMALALASILVFLYVKTRAHDPSSYYENVAVLRQLKQLDARWELDVLKSRIGINTNYDSLVDPLVEIEQLRSHLQRAVEVPPNGGASAVTDLGEALHRAIEQKIQLIEHFKSHNSILHNSLAFLPTAAADVDTAVRQGQVPDRAQEQFSAKLGKVLLDSVVYSQTASKDAAVEVRAELDRLFHHALPPGARDPLDVFAAHVRTVLREQPEVNTLLSRIADVPTSASIDAIDNTLARQQRAVEVQSQRYRKYLLLFAGALVALFLYATVNLFRSHAVINRVNQQLQGANATLEQRVQERTCELQTAQSELMATARQAGMAEIANNVLHNVGNVLTSVNVSAGVVGDMVRRSKGQRLSKVAQLLSEHTAGLADFFTHDERGKVLPAYLSKLATVVAAEQSEIVTELQSMTRSIDHIKEIVAKQQSYSGPTSVAQPVRVKELMEDALRMNATSIDRHQIVVVKEFAEMPVLLLDQHLVLQILVNLIGNAKQAMEGITDRAHEIAVRTELLGAAEGPRRLRICVADNGEGISPENLKRLFTHGFTTRKQGHGFGLHSCALAAKEMEGRMTAQSDGSGRGARFTLEIPVREALQAA